MKNGSPEQWSQGSGSKAEDSVALALFTICSRNYLPYAKALVASVRRQMPDRQISVILAVEDDDVAKIRDFVGARVLLARDLGIPTYYDMAMRYDVVEFNTAIKPFGFQWLFNEGADAVAYLDPDLHFHAPLTEVDEAFRAGYQAVITPHICEPLDMEKNPTELKLLRTGVYNLGFGAIANTEDGRRFVDWWASNMSVDCRADLDAGLFVDQKFIDLMPSYLPRTKILRHPGYNVAYWNLAHRPIQRQADGGFSAKGQPLVFMHYSGVRANQNDIVSVHQDRVSVDGLGDGRALFQSYRAELRSHQSLLKELAIDTSYAYGQFMTGEDIPALARSVYAKSVPPQALTFEKVFDLNAGTFSAGTTGIDHDNQHLISPIMADLWLRKPHLQAAFNIRDADEAEAFALWFAATGHKEWKIDPNFIPQAVWNLRRKNSSLSSKTAMLVMQVFEFYKKLAFLFPKPVRRAAVRWNRRILPALVSRMKTR